MEENQKKSTDSLALCLLSYLKLQPTEKAEIKLLSVIARLTIQKIESGTDTVINSKEIFLEMFPAGDVKDTSAKLANIWKKIPNFQAEIRNRISEHAVNEFQLDVYPWVEKIDSDGGAGKLVKYRVVGIAINKAEIASPNIYRELLAHDIEYTAVQDFQPSWLARLLFDEKYEITDYKKWIMIFYPFIQMLFYLFMIVVLLIALRNETLADLSFYKVSILIAAFWFFISKVRRFERFTDDKIIIASDYFMGWSELTLLQELVTVKDENDNFLYKKVQLTKYVGICPICKAQVELNKGEPDFPQRIVGRCKESPREHVYSFDRVTKFGNMLRGFTA
ncbi:MAG: hypothetical protein ACO1N8_05080 [Methylophilus sp.]